MYAIPDDKPHSARWRRSAGGIGLFVDEQQAQLVGRNNPDGGGTKYVCFELDPGQGVRVRHFAITIKPR